MSDKKSIEYRRKLLKSIAAGSGAIVAGKALPESWSRPVVDSVMLPAHAMTSPGNQYTNLQQMTLLDNQSRLARVMDSLVPEVNAAHGEGGPTEITCLTITGESIVKIEGLIDNASGFAMVTAQNVTVGGAAVPMVIDDCPDPIDSGIGQITVQVATLTNASATGTYNIGGRGPTVPFTVTPGSCSAPACPLLSDIRLKSNIEALSISREGYNLYKFQYIDENNENTYVGIMAQDILARNPEAIVQNESGFYMVRYAQLGLKMVTLKQWESEGPDSVELMH